MSAPAPYPGAGLPVPTVPIVLEVTPHHPSGALTCRCSDNVARVFTAQADPALLPWGPTGGALLFDLGKAAAPVFLFAHDVPAARAALGLEAQA